MTATVAALAAVSSLSQSNQAQDQAHQVAVTDYSNASQAIANMQAVEAQASAQEEVVRQSNAQTLGRQRAAMADSGTGSIGSGSNLDVGRQSAYAAEIDALNTRYAGELRGSQYLQTAYNYQAQGRAAQLQADQISQSKIFNAGVAALTAGATSYSRGIKGTTNLSSPGTGTNSYGFTMPGLN
ncbi:hypothetical protein [Burkholderia gladioli]|uniref:hypothetical protein n=1 Tax=Burkholderia gladioli TaxID=28095 RepID=UPI0015E6619D|nr:hypothetical protein [Burkholderia gladioli]MBA1364041.1 hypothetical protein [Burkholderia gladioli]